jgi:hypothetical protein
MATTKGNMKQTATNTAAALTAAFAQAGFFEGTEQAMSFFRAQVEETFKDLEPLAEAASTGGGYRKASGAKSGGSKTGEVPSDGSLSLKGGVFNGYTIAQVWGFSKEDIKNEGIEYDRTGREYVTWLANNTHPKAQFKRDRAKAFIEAQQAGVAE